MGQKTIMTFLLSNDVCLPVMIRLCDNPNNEHMVLTPTNPSIWDLLSRTPMYVIRGWLIAIYTIHALILKVNLWLWDVLFTALRHYQGGTWRMLQVAGWRSIYKWCAGKSLIFSHCSLSFLLSFLICPLSLILFPPKTIQLYVLQQLQVVQQQLSLVLWLLNTMIELSLGSDPKVSLLFPVIHSLVLFGCNSPTSTEFMMLSWKTLRNMMLSPCKVFL